MTDMRLDHEDHRESPHRIDVFYPLLRHSKCKNKEKSWNSWQIERKILLLWHERKNQLDRLGEGIGSDYRRVLPFAPIAGVVLLQVSAVCNHRDILFHLRLSEERQRQRQGELEEIFTKSRYTLYNI